MPSRSYIPIQEAGRVLVDMDAAVSKELLDHVVTLGGKVVSSSAVAHSIRLMIPFAQLETLAGRPDIKSISPGTISDSSVVMKAAGAPPGPGTSTSKP
ncbi:MAG: hypothetical protein ABIP85_12425 [Chthoniobacteraceae bacterium]